MDSTVLFRLTHSFRLKTKVASKYNMSSQPRLVDIIAAVPQEHKKVKTETESLLLLGIIILSVFRMNRCGK